MTASSGRGQGHHRLLLGRVFLLSAGLLPLTLLWTWIAGVGDLFARTAGENVVAPMGAALLTLTAFGLFVLCCRRERLRTRNWVRLICVLSVLGGSLPWVRHGLGFDVPVERWILEGALQTFGRGSGRLSELTGTACILFGISLGLLAGAPAEGGGWQRSVVRALMAVPFAVGAAFAIAEMLGRPLSLSAGWVSMAPWAGVACALQAVAFSLLSPTVGTSQPGLRGPDSTLFRMPLRVPAAIAGVAMAVGALYLRDERAQVRQTAMRDLEAILESKVADVGNWRHERLSDARFFGQAAFVARDLRAFLENADSARHRSNVLDWLTLLKAGDRYRDVGLFDARGRMMFSVPAMIGAPADALEIPPGEVLATNGVHVSDARLALEDGAPSIELVSPIPEPTSRREGAPAPAGSDAWVGFLRLRIDPSQHLYPLIQSWPTPSSTAETLLLRRERDGAFLLNAPSAASGSSKPVLRHLPADGLEVRRRVVSGPRTLAEGLDHRGVPVLGAVQAVPATPWTLLVKLDWNEVYAPLHRQAWLTLALVGVIAAGGGMTAAYGWVRHQRKAEEERLNLAERVSLLMQQANDIILLLDEDGAILEANRRAEEAYGYPAGQLTRLHWHHLERDADPGGFARQAGEFRGTRGLLREAVHLRMDQSEFAAESSLAAVEVGGRRYYQAIVRDLTVRKQAEDALRISEERLRVALDSTRMAVFDWDVASDTVQWTGNSAALFGVALDRGSLSRDKLVLHANEEDRERVRDAFGSVLRGAPGFETEFSVAGHGPGRRWLMIKGVARRGEGAVAMRVVGVSVDVTERRAMEREKQELEAKIRHGQKLEAIGTLASGVAHEINNPIMGVMNYAQLIVDESVGATPTTKYAREILRETERVTAIVRSLLQFARHDQQEHRPASIHEIVEGTLSLIRGLLRKDQILLEVDLEPAIPPFPCRSQQIQQVLMNLAANARDAVVERYVGPHPDRRIWIQARLRNVGGRRWLRLTVEDRGHGVPSEIRGRIFDPFFTTKTRDKGTGLGLSISHGIVKEHGGELHLESEPGVRTCFHVDLPVDRTPVPGSGVGAAPTASHSGVATGTVSA